MCNRKNENLLIRNNGRRYIHPSSCVVTWWLSDYTTFPIVSSQLHSINKITFIFVGWPHYHDNKYLKVTVKYTNWIGENQFFADIIEMMSCLVSCVGPQSRNNTLFLDKLSTKLPFIMCYPITVHWLPGKRLDFHLNT